MPRSVELSLELLRTFETLARNDGDAGKASRQLNVDQPRISRRLAHLQHAGGLLRRPWLEKKGKTWELTNEGRRVLPAATEIVRRYDNLKESIDTGHLLEGQVRFACGRQMVQGLVRQALRRFRKRRQGTALRISTMRGKTRIEGVANGALDLAIVTHDEPSIRDIARRLLHVASFQSHHLCLVCAENSPWSEVVRRLPKKNVSPKTFDGFPLILPEPDAGIRKTFDKTIFQQGMMGKIDITLELGGWSTILSYVRDGVGVGVVSDGALGSSKGLIVRYLDPELFSPIEAKLICRRVPDSSGKLDLSEEATAWRDVLLQTRGQRNDDTL